MWTVYIAHLSNLKGPKSKFFIAKYHYMTIAVRTIKKNINKYPLAC